MAGISQLVKVFIQNSVQYIWIYYASVFIHWALTHLRWVSHMWDTWENKNCQASRRCDAGSDLVLRFRCGPRPAHGQILGQPHALILKLPGNYYFWLQNILSLVVITVSFQSLKLTTWQFKSQRGSLLCNRTSSMVKFCTKNINISRY